MGHPKKLLDYVEKHVREKYPTAKLRREKKLVGEPPNPVRQMYPDIQIVLNGVAHCVVEIGDNNPDKLALYKQYGINDIRWYSKTTGDLVFQTSGNADGLVFGRKVSVTAIRTAISKAVSLFSTQVEHTWKKVSLAKGRVLWVAEDNTRHNLQIDTLFSQGPVCRFYLDHFNEDCEFPRKLLETTSPKRNTKFEYSCRHDELELLVPWILEMFEWLNTEQDFNHDCLRKKDLEKLPPAPVEHYCAGHWGPGDYLWSKRGWNDPYTQSVQRDAERKCAQVRAAERRAQRSQEK